MEPFLASEALDSGALTFRELKLFHRSIFPGVWVDRAADVSMVGWCRGGWLWSRRTAVLAGLSASAALGARWIDAETPVELVHTNRRPPSGIIVHTDRLAEGETQIADGLPVTTPARTAFDLGRRLTLEGAVQRIDALMNVTDVKVVDIQAVTRRHPRSNGLRGLRKALALVDGGAESPYESLTRLLLVQNGFPRPETQIRVYDDNGHFVARVDMGWREYRVGVDFDGAHHWTEPSQFTRDVDRYARLPEVGWLDIRLTSGMLHNAPQVFLRRVGDALSARGWADATSGTPSAASR